jgi:uncharacterized caspase-like protein
MRFDARILALAAALLLEAATAAAADRALLIGINDYRDPRIDDLRGPSLDVENMRRLLIEDLAFPNDGLKILAEGQATRAAVFDAIENWLIAGTERGDRVYLYFSGHGAQVKIRDEGGGVHLTTGLVPYDADQSVADDSPGVGGRILGSRLGELIRRMQGREVTVVVDACHSGSLTRGADRSAAPDNVRTITPFGPIDLDDQDLTDELTVAAKTGLRLLDFNAKGGTPLEGVAVWSAATMAQFSWDSPAGGIFTNAFVTGLRDRRASFSADGRVSASSLLAYVRDGAESYCATNPRCLEVGFTPELLAPAAYRADVLIPYFSDGDAPDGAPEGGDGEAINDDAADELVEEVPELVDLAEGVFSHENDFGLDATILPDARIALGDAVRFRIRSEETGQVVVLDSGPDGALRRIFPNAYSEAAGRAGTVAGGQVLTIPDESYPFEFTATDPGPGTLVVLVTEPGVDLEPLFASSDFEIIKDVDKALVAIAAELQAPVLDPDPDVPNRAHKWAFVTVPYLVGR